MPIPLGFFERPDAEIRRELMGFPATAIEAVLHFRTSRSSEALAGATLAILAFYLPKGRDRDLAKLPDETRLSEDLGVDSLTLAEAAFKLDELFGVPIGTREVGHLATLGELQQFLSEKLGVESKS